MKTIDDKIQQYEFRDERHRLFLNLMYNASRLMAAVDTFLQPYDLTFQQFNILRILRGQMTNPVAICAIRERLLDRNADVSRLIDRLLKKDLVTRIPSDIDRRRVEVRITDRGLALLAEIDQKNKELNSVMGNISSEDARQLNDLLDKLEQ